MTLDARLRAETIAANSGSELGDLKSANMGVFQITGQNSNEDYSWGGAFNSKIKLFRANLRWVTDTTFFLFRLAKLFA